MLGPLIRTLCFACLLLGACSSSVDIDRVGGQPAAEADSGSVAVQPETDAGTGTAPGSNTTPTENETDAAPVVYDAVVIATHPHDDGAYTQGLEFVDGRLLESTGLVGESSIRLVEPATGEVIESAQLDEVYGEGATIVGDEIFQLTWKDQTMIVHSLDDLTERRRLSYAGEGWGLCRDGDRLIMSNGSDRLTFRDPATFDRLDEVPVTERGMPVEKLNELECVADRVWANIFQTDRIVEIDPSTGRVIGTVDLSALVPDGLRGDDTNVLNGIAYEAGTERFWVTGKRWPVMYEIELVPAP